MSSIGFHRPFTRTSTGRMMLAASVAAAGLLGGCTSGPTRPVRTDQQLQEMSIANEAQMRHDFSEMIGRLILRIEDEEARAQGSVPPVLDILALSGGGDYGAFGAGFLVGWGSIADAEHARPEFDAVSGVSTGALLAPFAYVDTDESVLSVETLYRNPKKDWIDSRGLLGFLPWSESFATIPGLKRDIRAAVDDRLIEQMALQSKAGKLLIISATDLDFGRQQIWDVGAAAEAVVAGAKPDRVQDILFASSAIPAAFPPVQIDGLLYADGGVTANVLLRLDPHSPDALIQRWLRKHPGRALPKVRYWIIVNNQLAQAPKTVEMSWSDVLGPTISTAIRAATVTEIRWLTAQAHYVNAFLGTNIEVRMVAIPDDWRPPVTGDFKKANMESLALLGRKLGADPGSWRLLVSPATHAAPAGAN